MDLNSVWFFLISVLIIGYAILDGFDFGVGIIHLFTRKEEEKRINLNAIGPVWDGNEVWLLTAGGALFAAFPIVYGSVFSALYIPLMLLLFALIFRAVSMEFRGKVDSESWKKKWDTAFGLGSLLPAVLFGAAVGNILKGMPVQEDGVIYITLLAILNPYALLIGVLSFVMFLMQGAAYLTLKTEGEQLERMAAIVTKSWMVYVVLYIIATISTYFVSPFLFEGVLSNPLFWIVFILLLGAVVYIPVAVKAKTFGRLFLCTSGAIALMISLMGVSLFPRLVPSTLDLANSLTIYNASSSQNTLYVMLIITLIGMPMVIGYTIWIYKIFRGKVVIGENSY
ncbi:MAG: cytochrome d ubiquinol oxidase subunit II [bacterium]|nr:cytochrome d ubiquinol oxidase subunit II [bacterium]